MKKHFVFEVHSEFGVDTAGCSDPQDADNWLSTMVDTEIDEVSDLLNEVLTMMHLLKPRQKHTTKTVDGVHIVVKRIK